MTEGKTIGCTLYVVALDGNERLDGLTAEVAAVFARCGFAVVVHSGPASVPDVLEGVRLSHALSVLLSPGLGPETRQLATALDDVVEFVMAVGKDGPNEREGDRREPFRIHPDDGEERMVWLAGFVRRGLQGAEPVDGSTPERAGG
jgi:hypothetical protein